MKIMFADGWQIELDDVIEGQAFFYVLGKGKDGFAVIDLDKFCKILNVKNEWYTEKDKRGNERQYHDGIGCIKSWELRKGWLWCIFFKCIETYRDDPHTAQIEINPDFLRLIHK